MVKGQVKDEKKTRVELKNEVIPLDRTREIGPFYMDST